MLSQLDVLVVDCQATAAAPHGRLLELGWARAAATVTQTQARLIALPDGERIPPAVVRITGISDQMAQQGVEARAAWDELADTAAAFARQPAPTIIHFARFEQPFLSKLAGGPSPLDIVCTHEIARRLLPNLPRRTVRALAGYFGHGIGTLRRSADHVEATAFVWRALVRLLEDEGISTWKALQTWLAATTAPTARRQRVWPMPREVRLALPDAPGIYRMLRTNGDVLYVGKASSLHHRVNSYFRKQNGTGERTLEMLSQARGVSFALTPSALEAALLESDEIKQHRPPYNVALMRENRTLWFTAADLSGRNERPTSDCALGPFSSAAADHRRRRDHSAGGLRTQVGSADSVRARSINRRSAGSVHPGALRSAARAEHRTQATGCRRRTCRPAPRHRSSYCRRALAVGASVGVTD